MNYGLPTTLEICGTEWEIRSDYRCILEICAAIEDPELDKQDKAYVAMTIFYPDFDDIPPEDHEEALRQCFWFINGGADNIGKKGPKLMSWEQDFQYIAAPVNRVLGQEIRSVPYDLQDNSGGLHWWTFLSAYMEIGDCVFAQIVRIRSMLAKGKRLEKADREWYDQNRHLVDLRQTFSEAEDDLLKQWGA
ncbi:MAG: hypothetical protein J6C98_10270 [Oscillospiraceae bacterium]|nr:hypothetical protein [Oscillospiraceae bacterium]